MSDAAATRDATRLLHDALDRDRLFSAASAEVGASAGALWRHALGRLSFDEGSPPAGESTIFDLASLTKPLATTGIILQLLAEGRVRLEERLPAFFRDCRHEDRQSVTLRDLLEHASGLPARLLDAPPGGRREFEHEICRTPLEHAPRTRALYSDLGFILLGFVAADRGHSSLPALFARQLDAASFGDAAPGEGLALTFRLPPDARKRTAATVPLPDDLRRGRTLAGDVHDNYAAALGGAAGHAGLFGTASGVGWLARAVLRAARGDASLPPPFTPELVTLAATRSRVPGSSRALGWDTMLPTSSCGERLSPAAIGHVGFTGTSLWIDPPRDRYYVLLTNRAAGSGTLEQMASVRRRFHDILAEF